MRIADQPSPLFSVVVPAFNAQDTISKTIDSVLVQEFANFELVIVDDGSTDDTASIVQGYVDGDPRIRLIRRQNGGTGAAYNTGIEAARGEWIVMLSADDMIAPAHLAAMELAIREHPESSAFTSNGWYLYDNGTRTLVYPQDPPFDKSGCELSQLLDRCFFPVGATFSRKACLDVGGLEPGFYAEDYYLFLRLLASGYRHTYVDAPLAIHTRNRRQKSAAGLSMRQGDAATIRRILDDFELSETDVLAAKTSLNRLQANIAIRKKLYAIFGARAGEVIIEVSRFLRGRA